MDIIPTILSQYANSPRIMTILDGLNEAFDPSAQIDEFYRLIFNVNTAEGYGLDVWGRIVGIGRTVSGVDGTDKTFGFNETDYFTPFNDAPFNGSGAKFSSFQLPDTQYRQLIMIKAYANILYATAPNINKFLYSIFGKRAYYRITGDMTAQYVFEFTPDDFERLIIFNLGILPIPCGISVEYTILDISNTLGFNGSGLQTFNNGTFRR